MTSSLTRKEEYALKQRLRNKEKLHQAARDRVVSLEQENKHLKQVIKERDARVDTLEEEVTTLKLQIEELRTMVFGKRKKRGTGTNNTNKSEGRKKPARPPRTKQSRPIPTDEEVTEIIEHPIEVCTCGETLTEQSTRTYYEEDIPLQSRIVRKHTVHTGWCVRCRKRVSAIPLPCAEVVLGETVKRYITYLSVVCRLSYSQIQTTLMDIYHMPISEGEIAHILKREGGRLRPFYEQLLKQIRGEPSVHLDETGWLLFAGDGYQRYAWVMVGGVSGDAVFTLGRTRGKGNATELLGDSKAVVVSDDYRAYRTLENPHQLCCAHILRKLRDVAQARDCSNELRTHCTEAYHTFAGIYTAIERARATTRPRRYYTKLLAQLRAFAVPHNDDPKPVKNVRTQIRERGERYLTCVLHPHTRADNNPAERALRPLVQKRKVSFGSMNETRAEILGVLTSVLYTLRQRNTLGAYLRGEVVGV